MHAKLINESQAEGPLHVKQSLARQICANNLKETDWHAKNKCASSLAAWQRWNKDVYEALRQATSVIKRD